MSSKIGRGRASLFPLRSLDTRPGHDYTRNLLHADTDAICPKCMSWISGEDIVRRTAYGLLQHEACYLSDKPNHGALEQSV